MVTTVFPTRNFTAVNYFDTTKIITTVIWNTDNNILSTSPQVATQYHTTTPLPRYRWLCLPWTEYLCLTWTEYWTTELKGENKWSDNLWLGCEIVPLENKFPPVSVLECDQVGFCAWIVPTIPADLAAVGRLPSAANRILRASIPRSGKQW